jgi:hypothetical protein
VITIRREGMLADLEVEHVFSVSYASTLPFILSEFPDVLYRFSIREKEIIQHPYSCYVLGRSGTG